MAAAAPPWREFARRRDGMVHAMDGGLWLHRHVWKGTPMAHLVSTDRELLLEVPGAFIDEDSADQIRGLLSKGAIGLGFILTTDDCRATFEKLRDDGVDIIQEPEERFYGTDCAVRDPFGNHIRITQPAPAPRFSRTGATLGSRPARPGEHTREALAAWGIDDVDALLDAGAAVQA